MNTWLNRLQITAFLFAAAMLAGCGKVSDSQVRTSSGMVGAFGSPTCPNGVSAVGEVYDSPNNTQQMTALAKGLVSATLDPASLGNVPARGGIDLELRIPRNAFGSGAMLSAESPAPAPATARIRLQIKDSWTGTKDSAGKVIPPYPVSISQISSSGRNMFGQYEVVFADQYGSITVAFTSTGQQVTGTISYQNSVHAAGGAPAKGVLGAFSIPACAVFY